GPDRARDRQQVPGADVDAVDDLVGDSPGLERQQLLTARVQRQLEQKGDDVRGDQQQRDRRKTRAWVVVAERNEHAPQSLPHLAWLRTLTVPDVTPITRVADAPLQWKDPSRRHRNRQNAR